MEDFNEPPIATREVEGPGYAQAAGQRGNLHEFAPKTPLSAFRNTGFNSFLAGNKLS